MAAKGPPFGRVDIFQTSSDCLLIAKPVICHKQVEGVCRLDQGIHAAVKDDGLGPIGPEVPCGGRREVQPHTAVWRSEERRVGKECRL